MRLFFRSLRFNFTSVLTMLTLLVAVAGCGLDSATQAKKVIENKNQMRALILGMKLHRTVNHNEWPEELAQIRKFTENKFDEFMHNPITGDNPGYEYVKPPQDADLQKTVVLYQLNDGIRDTSLEVGYGDNTVSALGSQD